MGTQEPEEQRPFEITVSRHFSTWLAEQQVSLAFATPPSKLFLIGLRPGGELSIFERTFNKTMGLAKSGTDTVYLGTRYQIWKLESPLRPGQLVEEEYDRFYIPRKVYTTGTVNVHDVGVDGQGRVLFVNTRFGCLAAVSDQYSFVPLWKPPFLAEIRPGDRCHLNGLALRDGRPAYVTSVSRKDELDGWRDDRRSGGAVIDVTTDDIVLTGLSMPHSPRIYRDQLWLTNSGTGQFGRVDVEHNRFEPVAFAPGFLRGLDFVGDYAVVGSSKPRHGDAYSGLELDEVLGRRKSQPRLGLFIVNLQTGAIDDWLFIEGPMRELYDVVVLPGVRQPMALGLIPSNALQFMSTQEKGEVLNFGLPTPTASADLSIVKTAQARSGTNQLFYTLTVNNGGPSTAQKVVVTDILPPLVKFVSSSAQSTQTWSCACASTTRTVTCKLGSLGTGKSSQLRLLVQALSGSQPLKNCATVTASTFDPNFINNTSCLTLLQPTGPTSWLGKLWQALSGWSKPAT